MADYLFYLFATCCVVSALAVIGCRNPVNGALALVLFMLGVAANLFLLDAPFAGTLLALVYGGAVVVLFLFVVMLLDTDRTEQRPLAWRTDIFALLLLALLFAGSVWLVCAPGHLPSPPAVNLNAATTGAGVGTDANVTGAAAAGAALPAGFPLSAKQHGVALFTKYMLPVQLAGMLLFAAMLGVSVISRKKGARQ
ncbi:MAG: NADH-quinone oxidoreductase subunit J [Puniceicoccales bacterium]|jgi:NADH-quinone oxidoreductase subunit J|nr:NADH-quinone oxidoreductase subunit J [Puniceicoccales bacterium]